MSVIYIRNPETNQLMALELGSADAVLHTEQTLTEAQKSQARANLGITGTGADGHTPIKGTDYWTESDKAEIKAYVDEAILGGAW